MGELSFAGRVALVTGAGSGLGRSYALELARRGCKVVVNDYGGVSTGNAAGTTSVGIEKAQAVVDQIKAAGGEAIAHGGSVSDYEAVKQAVQLALDNWGRIDIAIHNAGIYRDRRMENLTENDYDLTLGVHVKGAFNVVRHVWGPMVEQKYGRIVLTSSGGAFGGPGNYLLYGTAKSAMIGMCKNLKDNGLPFGIRVNVMMPGAATAMSMNDPTGTMIPKEMREAFEKDFPPELVMPATLYLCHEDCQDSGETIAAEMGNFGRVALVKGPMLKTNPRKEGAKSIEWAKENWDTIMGLDKDGNQILDGFIEMGPGGRKLEGKPFGRRPVKPPKVVTKDGVARGAKL